MSDMATNTALAATKPEKIETPFKRFRAEIIESKIATLTLCVFLIILMLATLSPWVTPQKPCDLV